MNHSICTCFREHKWQTPTPMCPCGKIQEPQTKAEHATLKAAHLRALDQILQNNTSLRDKQVR